MDLDLTTCSTPVTCNYNCYYHSMIFILFMVSTEQDRDLERISMHKIE